MIKYFLIFALLLTAISAVAQGIEEKPGFKNINVSNDASKLIFSHDEQRGFYLLDLNTSKTILIDNNKFSAYQASFSVDGNLVAFKKFIETENGRLQQPVLYNIQTGKIKELFEPVRRCGTPSFASDGNIVFTIGKDLYLINFKGKVLKTIKLQSYSNLTPVSADGNHIVFNDNQDRLWLLNLSTSEKRRFTPEGQGFFEPHWSPDGQRIVASSLSGELSVLNKNDDAVIYIGSGKHPVWADDNKNIIYSKAEVLENREVLSQELYSFNIENKIETKLTASSERENYPAIAGNKIYYSSMVSGLLFSADLVVDKIIFKVQSQVRLKPVLNSNYIQPTVPILKKKDPLSAVYFDIPYVNQRYDTPNWFNGNWACGATSAIQCIAYFGLVHQWPVWVSSPFYHVSDYGNYICEIYTYNGTTFNIGGRDPNGNIGYGGYGYIIKNNWANTKAYMRDYAIIHGLSSAVDWSPTRGKVVTEILNEDPFVLLNSLTSSGHYISVIGYDNIDTTTVIVNDPYGNKNNGYANFYGRRSWYDWPGYNNGYENLNTVHCYIYFRGNPPADIAVQSFTTNIDTGMVGQNIIVNSHISNIGNIPSLATNLKLFLSKNGIHDPNRFTLGSFQLPILQVGENYVFQDSLNLPDSLISDSYDVYIFADADTINFEKLKDNNIMHVDLVINGYPSLYSILPIDGSVISEPRPQIRVRFQDYITTINLDSVKLYLDNQNITDSSTVLFRKIEYFPGYDLSEGVHNLRVEVPSNAGIITNYNWSFEIQLASNIDNLSLKPGEFYLTQNYPNPFNPNTNIAFNLPIAGNISLKIFDISGNLISEVVNNKFYSAGYHKLSFNGESLASGVYFYTLLSENNSITKKMLLLR